MSDIEFTNIGTAYFLDGHTEDIFQYKNHRKGEFPLIEFHTPSGMYIYRVDDYPMYSTKLGKLVHAKRITENFLQVGIIMDGCGNMDFMCCPADIEKIEIKEKNNDR